jgi:hypothetical protein
VCVREREGFDPICRPKVNSGKGAFLFDPNNKNCPAVNKVAAVQFYAPVFPSYPRRGKRFPRSLFNTLIDRKGSAFLSPMGMNA